MKILISESSDFPKDSLVKLSNIGDVYLEGDKYPSKEIDVLFVRLNELIGKNTHNKFPKLKYIISPTTGTNHIDLTYFNDTNVNIITLKDRLDFLNTVHATSEHTIALALALLRQIPAATKDTLNANWNRYPFKGKELHSSNVLIYGYGRVGKQVAKLYSSFGCNVKAYDIDNRKIPKKYSCEIESFLPNVDILSLHMDLNESNHGIINNEFMEEMSKDSKIVNTSRGELVNQDQLLDKIIRRDISGAAIDVLHNEPNPFSSDLIKKIKKCGDRLIITPHISGFTYESLEKVENHITSIFLQSIKREKNEK